MPTTRVKGSFVDLALKEAVREAAYQSRISQSQLVRNALDRFVKNPNSAKRWGKVPPSGKVKLHAPYLDADWALVLGAAESVGLPISNAVRLAVANEVRRVDPKLYPKT